jgi:hypothetical protein
MDLREVAEALALAIDTNSFCRAKVWEGAGRRRAAGLRVYVYHRSTKREIPYGHIDVTEAGLLWHTTATGSDGRSLYAAVKSFSDKLVERVAAEPRDEGASYEARGPGDENPHALQAAAIFSASR